jgi:hypothetical protein
MPVIIDQLDLVDTTPASAGEVPTPPATARAPVGHEQAALGWRLAARRAARVRAD